MRATWALREYYVGVHKRGMRLVDRVSSKFVEMP